MTYLSWDEVRTCVLGMATFRGIRAGTDRARPEDAMLGCHPVGDHGEHWMNSIRRFRLAMIALVPVAAISFGIGAAPAQTAPPPSSGTPATPAPVETNTPPPVTTTTPTPT